MINVLKTAVMVAKLGAVITDNKKDNNAWRKRMLTAGGVTFPDDWDELPEEEKTRRLELCEAVQDDINNYDLHNNNNK